MKKLFSTLLLGGSLVVGAANAQVYVRIGPPPPARHEVLPSRPGPRYVWVEGSYRWDGRRYYWRPGTWVLPPGRYDRWVPGHWVNSRHGYYWVEGHWR
jgi:hypothetical protein